MKALYWILFVLLLGGGLFGLPVVLFGMGTSLLRLTAPSLLPVNWRTVPWKRRALWWYFLISGLIFHASFAPYANMTFLGPGYFFWSAGIATVFLCAMLVVNRTPQSHPFLNPWREPDGNPFEVKPPETASTWRMARYWARVYERYAPIPPWERLLYAGLSIGIAGIILEMVWQAESDWDGSPKPSAFLLLIAFLLLTLAGIRRASSYARRTTADFFAEVAKRQGLPSPDAHQKQRIALLVMGLPSKRLWKRHPVVMTLTAVVAWLLQVWPVVLLIVVLLRHAF